VRAADVEAAGSRGVLRWSPERTTQAWLSAFLLAQLAGWTWVRVEVAGPARASHPVAGLLFGAGLAACALAVGWRPDRRLHLVAGLAGGLVLCFPVVVLHVVEDRSVGTVSGFLAWFAVIVVVVWAEEAFLRGALFAVVQRAGGALPALMITSLAFGLLHVPVYGWHVLAVDVAAGAWLGALRLATGSYWPAVVAHMVADAATWWLP
jgi:membrane protease YdiL (CAAX protease family)